MRVYLVQHGEAVAKDVDAERPLTEKGVEDVKKVAGFLRGLKVRVGAIWHSGKRRAEQTAEILAGAVSAGEGVVQREGLSPKDEVRAVRREIEQGGQDVMIVGHLPFLSRLVSNMAADGDSVDVVRFQQGGVVCMERDEEGRWSVTWMVVPEILRRGTTD